MCVVSTSTRMNTSLTLVLTLLKQISSLCPKPEVSMLLCMAQTEYIYFCSTVQPWSEKSCPRAESSPKAPAALKSVFLERA